MFELPNLPKLVEKVTLRESFRDWPLHLMQADDSEAADYSFFEQNGAITVFDIEDGIQYHIADGNVVRYRRISPNTVVREFVVMEVVL